MYIRSLYLSPLPIVKRAGRAWRRIRRTIMMTSVAAFLILLYVIIDTRYFARNGPAYLLYWLHDNLYLPLLAYSYTLFFPTSLIWWLIGIFIAGLWLFSFLSDWSLILQPHIRWLRKEVMKVQAHRWLYLWASRLHRLGIQPRLLQLLVEHERTLCLGAISAATPGSANPRAYELLASLTILSVKLHLLSSKGTNLSEAHLKAAIEWQTTLLWLRLHDQHKPLDPASPVMALLALAPELVRPVATTPALWRQRTNFDATTLLVDLAYVAARLEGTNVESIIRQNTTTTTQNGQSASTPPTPE
jgi:hypothetical protein